MATGAGLIQIFGACSVNLISFWVFVMLFFIVFSIFCNVWHKTKQNNNNNNNNSNKQTNKKTKTKIVFSETFRECLFLPQFSFFLSFSVSRKTGDTTLYSVFTVHPPSKITPSISAITIVKNQIMHTI